MENKDFLITFTDLIQLFKRGKKCIGRTCLICALLGCLFGLLRPVVYIAKGSFRDKATSESSAQDTSASLKILGLNDSGTSEALSWMQSRHLLGKLAERLALQAEIEKKPPSLLARVFANVQVETALWMKLKRPSLPDLQKEIAVVEVDYSPEYPTVLTIAPLDAARYQVAEKGKVIGQGTFGAPFQTAAYSFTLAAHHAKEPSKLVLWPKWKVVDDLVKTFQIKADTKDKTLFNLSFAHRDRKLACAGVNQLMELYLEQMRHQHRFLLQEHLSYLQKRQDEMNENLKSVLEQHVAALSSDLSTSGFPSSESVIDYLAETQLQYTKSLHAIEMEIIRLKNFKESGLVYHDHYHSEEDPHTINAALAEIRQLKKQSDVIELALKNHAFEQNLSKFADLIEEHKNVHLYAAEVKEISEKLKNNEALAKAYRLFQEPRYIAGVWNDRLQLSAGDDYTLCSAHFQNYLGNLEHFFEVYEKTLKERITHQQNPPDELQGINLETAQEVYGGYCKTLSDIESNRRQFEYVLEQMHDAQFEISSLSAILSDPVSQRMIEKASGLELSLKEEGNRSVKEVERLKGELAAHRGFLHTHIRQSLELIKIREKLLHEKSYNLQQTTLELIQQQISILEKYLEDFIETRLANLMQEKQYIYQQQAGLQEEMGKIPGKWVFEKMIDQQMRLNQQLMAELTKLVENKNISTNLEAVRSTPVDFALPPVHPRPPRILLFSLLGAVLGLFFSTGYLFGKTIIGGLTASPDNLKHAGAHVSGGLRSLLSYFEAAKPSSACRDLLLVLGSAPNFAEELALLLAKMDYRVLLMPLPCGQKVHSQGTYDSVEADPFAQCEALAGKRFQTLYKDLTSRYDWIIAYTTALPTSVEAEVMSANFERLALAISSETVEELNSWLKQNKKITYLFY